MDLKTIPGAVAVYRRKMCGPPFIEYAESQGLPDELGLWIPHEAFSTYVESVRREAFLAGQSSIEMRPANMKDKAWLSFGQSPDDGELMVWKSKRNVEDYLKAQEGK